jgi:hypothetical protein
MYNSFVDASGKHLDKDPENFVLNSITIHKSEQNYLNEKIDEIKQKHFPNIDPDYIEFHATEMIHHLGIFKKTKTQKIYKIFDDVFNLLADNHSKLFIVSSLIKKPKLYLGTDTEDLAYKFMLERINEEIKSMNDKNNSNERCVLVLDSEGDRDYEVTKKIHRITKRGTEFSDLKYISDEKILQNSKSSNLLQSSDFVAYAIRRRHRESTGNKKYQDIWNSYYDQMKSKFRRVNNHYYNHGLMIFPKTNWLSNSFCYENGISGITILDEPQIINTEYGKKLQCNVLCNDKKRSVKTLEIRKNMKKTLTDMIGGNLSNAVGKTFRLEFVKSSNGERITKRIVN